jgi:hypothetical protein
MAELDDAYGTTFSADCKVSFDIVTIYDTLGGIDNKNYLGIVSITSEFAACDFKYKVYPGGTVSGPVYSNAKAAIVTEGIVSKTNNTSFTFPIPSIECDYFVIVSPVNPTPVVAQTSRWQNKFKDTFAIFYPKRVLKERNTRMKLRDSIAKGTAFTPGVKTVQPTVDLRAHPLSETFTTEPLFPKWSFPEFSPTTGAAFGFTTCAEANDESMVDLCKQFADCEK